MQFTYDEFCGSEILEIKDEVYNYLINKGITVNRLGFKSFGSTKPIHKIPEKNEDERNENRRVEIQIMSIVN